MLYTYVYSIVYYLRKCEALHEITDFVHEMLSACAPLDFMYPKNKNPGVEVGTVGKRWHFSSLSAAAFVKFPIAEPCCLISLTEPYDIHSVVTL